MRHLAPLMMAAVMMGSCWTKEKGSSGNTFVLLDTQTDSTLYGVCLQMQGRDSMLFFSDNGDTTWFRLKKATVCGRPDTDNQLAIMLNPNGTLKKLINITLLMGTWVEPDPINGGYEMGISLLEGGAASSINSRIHNYTNWSFYNGKLLLLSQNDMENGYGEAFTDTFHIMELDANSLTMRCGEYTYHYSHTLTDSAEILQTIPGDTTDFIDYMDLDGDGIF